MFWRTIKQILKQSRSLHQILSLNFKNVSAKLIVSNRHYFHSMAALLQFAIIAATMEPTKFSPKRTMSKVKYKTTLDSKAQHYLDALKVRWIQLQEISGLFAYNLQETRQSRVLPGRHGFYVELNPDRALKRRAPQTIESMNPTFKPKLFNFNKVNDLEVMLTIDRDRDNSEVQMIINKSPISKYHTLVCPEVKSNLVQRLTYSSLSFCINFMRNIDDGSMRMGYNSPGALASVNHLHFHLLQMPRDLYIDNVELQELAGGYAFRLRKESPTEALCFVFSAKDDEPVVQEKIRNVHRLTEWLCNQNMPHNLFITQERTNGDLRLFIFVRETYCVNKDVTAFNVGFCEMVGFIPLSDDTKVQNLTERMVLQRIRSITGNIYDVVYEQVQDIVNGEDESPWKQPFVI